MSPSASPRAWPSIQCIHFVTAGTSEHPLCQGRVLDSRPHGWAEPKSGTGTAPRSRRAARRVKELHLPSRYPELRDSPAAITRAPSAQRSGARPEGALRFPSEAPGVATPPTPEPCDVTRTYAPRGGGVVGPPPPGSGGPGAAEEASEGRRDASPGAGQSAPGSVSPPRPASPSRRARGHLLHPAGPCAALPRPFPCRSSEEAPLVSVPGWLVCRLAEDS